MALACCRACSTNFTTYSIFRTQTSTQGPDSKKHAERANTTHTLNHQTGVLTLETRHYCQPTHTPFMIIQGPRTGPSADPACGLKVQNTAAGVDGSTAAAADWSAPGAAAAGAAPPAAAARPAAQHAAAALPRLGAPLLGPAAAAAAAAPCGGPRPG